MSDYEEHEEDELLYTFQDMVRTKKWFIDREELLKQENAALREQIAAKDEALRLTLSYWDDIGVKPCWIIDKAKVALGEDE